MLSLTEAAQDVLLRLVSDPEQPSTGLRLAVETGGCAGWQYRMALVDGPSAGDVAIACGKTQVFVADGSLDLLSGTTIDYVERLDGSGFTFENPNAAHKCSCGKSFAA